MRNITELQKRLIALGFPVGPDGADGRFGQDTLDAYNRFRASQGKKPVKQPNMSELNADLFPEEVPGTKPKPPKKPNLFETLSALKDINDLWKGKPMNSSWLTTFVASTAFKYLVAMAATYIASKLGLDKGSIEGILTQLVGVAMGVWGAWEASRNKIVMDGKKVAVSDLSTADKKAVSGMVADAQK